MSNTEWDRELDALILRGLLLINQPDEETPVVEHEYSPRYKRWERRFLANPFRYVKRKYRPVWAKTLQTAAAIILVIGVAFGTLVAVSPTVRAAVKRWFVEWFQTHDSYQFTDTPTEQVLGRWYPAYFPDGFIEMERVDTNGLVAITYENEDGKRIYLDYKSTVEGKTFQINNENVEVSTVMIRGSEGVFYQATVEQKPNVITWIDEGKSVCFRLIAYESRDALLLIARSIELAE